MLVDITPEPEPVLDRLLPRVQVRARDLVATLTPSERRSLIGILEKLEAHARSVEGPPDAPGGRNTPAQLRPPRTLDGRRRPADP